MTFLRGAAVLLLLSANLVVWGTVILIVALPKFVLPQGAARRRLILLLAGFADRWAATNNRVFDRFLAIEWDIEVPADLDRGGHYLIFANHISWADIFVALRVFAGRVAFLRFFLKQELFWMPVVGQACSALEFPFMKRYSADYLARHPEKRGTDLATTRRACERYRTIPVAILNFLEGTRFTLEKQAEQQSPYRYLLRPRSGGAAFVMSSLADSLEGVLDLTIAYPRHTITAWQFTSGRVPRVTARVRRLEVPEGFFTGPITEPGPAREAFNAWIERVWREKDDLLVRLNEAGDAAGGHAARR